MKTIKRIVFLAIFGFIAFNTVSLYSNIEDSDICLANTLRVAEANAEGAGGGGDIYMCWHNFSGGIAWCKQCIGCNRIPFATPYGDSSYCLAN